MPNVPSLIPALDSLQPASILVLGDSILDRYVWGDAERVSQEAPVVLLRADKEESRLGGAANVANMLSGLGARPCLASVVGADPAAETLRQELAAAGIDDSLTLVDPQRPTTVKERFIGRAQNRHPHQMLRVDRESRAALCTALTCELLERLLPRIPDFQAILVSDYGKGVCTAQALEQIISTARALSVPVLVDPRPGPDYQGYRRATAVTPNRLETRLATGIEIRDVPQAFEAGQALCRALDLDCAFITLDCDGMVLCESESEPVHLPTRKRHVYDITGAGDMVLATLGVALASGLDPQTAGRLANVAGGLEVERMGVVAISKDDMLADLLAHERALPGGKIGSLDDVARHMAYRRRLGQRIVFTNGCFDLLHAGHVSYLAQAAALGDCLVVAINSDASVRRLGKGPDRPINSQEHRAAMLAALEAVDHVVIFEETTPHAVLERLRPDLLVKGGTYRHDEIVGWELVEAYGGQVMALGAVPGLSTTQLVERVRERAVGAPALALSAMGEPHAAPIDRLPERKAG